MRKQKHNNRSTALQLFRFASSSAMSQSGCQIYMCDGVLLTESEHIHRTFCSSQLPLLDARVPSQQRRRLVLASLVLISNASSATSCTSHHWGSWEVSNVIGASISSVRYELLFLWSLVCTPTPQDRLAKNSNPCDGEAKTLVQNLDFYFQTSKH